MSHAILVDDLDIRPVRRVPVRGPVPPEMSGRIEQMLSLPAYWTGAADCRAQMYEAGDDSLQMGRAIVRAQIIGLKCAAGQPLHEITEYRDWLEASL